MNSGPTFRLDGRSHDLAGVDPRQSLLRWLNSHGEHGTKEGCGDGDCGACTVALVERDSEGRPTLSAINSCLLPMGALPGREVLTVVALAQGDQLHPAQALLVDHAGSQCGYCTPGFVMSLFVAHQRGECNEQAIEGNLCRCTGYRPIRDALQALSSVPRDTALPAALGEPQPAAGAAALDDFYSPTSISAAIALKARHPDARWLCGGTDLGVELSRGAHADARFIALDRVAELQWIERRADCLRIGAGVPLSRLERELRGELPPFDDLMPWFAARQVRNRATLGGNLGSASPIGDLLPVLLALDARVLLRGTAGERSLAIDGYFLDYRRTARTEDELIVAVEIPLPLPQHCGAYKVCKRQADDISIVAAAFALQFDGEGKVSRARLAYGGVAAVPLRAEAVERFLQGRALDAETRAAAAALLAETFAPLDDHRASADYRRALAANLFTRFVQERCA